MSTLSLRLPASLHDKIRELSERDEVSINQFIATAVAEKAAALLTVEYLEARGRRASRTQFARSWLEFRTCHRSQVTNCRTSHGSLTKRCSRRAALDKRANRKRAAAQLAAER